MSKEHLKVRVTVEECATGNKNTRYGDEIALTAGQALSLYGNLFGICAEMIFDYADWGITEGKAEAPTPEIAAAEKELEMAAHKLLKLNRAYYGPQTS